MRGGYLIIDFNGENIIETGAGTDTSVTIPGLYDKIEGNYGKPVLIENLSCEGKEVPAQFVAPYVEGGNYVFSTSTPREEGKTAMVAIYVTNEDKVNAVPTVG